NTLLQRLFILEFGQVPDQALNTSANTQLFDLRITGSGINSVDLANNPLLTNVELNSARLTSVVLNKVLIDLDNHGLSNGILKVNGNPGTLNITAVDAYNSLKGKGWDIDVVLPIIPVIGTITMTSTSSNANWQLSRVTNTGAILDWSASNALIGTQTAVVNNPLFNFSSNNGSPISITITSSDGFNGLRELDLYNSAGGESSFVTDIDIRNAVSLTTLAARDSKLASIDVSQNTLLQRLFILEFGQVPDQALNTSANTQLFDLRITGSGINSVNLLNNPLLTNVLLNNARLTSAVLDQVLIDLDNNGLSNGNIQISGNPGSLTFNSLIAYNNLVGKGWTIDVPAPAAAPGPEINVTLEGTSIPTGNVAAIADGTDFGQVAIGAPITKTFNIENLGDSPLTISFAATSGVYFSQTPQFVFGEILASGGGSRSIDITFTPLSVGVQIGSITIQNGDPNENPYIINLRAEGVTTITSGSIEVRGNNTVIANGDPTPSLTDDTDFGQTVINTPNTNTYTILNTGTTELTVSGITQTFPSKLEFVISNISQTLPYAIPIGGSMTFDVIFTPTATGLYSGGIAIANSDSNDNPFNFAIQGQGILPPAQIMFSQYYGGFNANDKWIEIVNISQSTIPVNTYYLALFDNSQAVTGTIETATPIALEGIPELAPGEVVLYRNPNADTSISFAGTPISSAVGIHDANDLLIITTSATGGYPGRVDVLGNINNATSWGDATVLIKGACSSETAHLTFNLNDWQEILIVDVDGADDDLNIELGTQRLGPTEFNGTWSNGVADESREVIVTGDFTGAGQSIRACNLIINSGVNLNFDSNGTTSNSIIIEGDVTVNGTFTVGDTESL
ncbi:MAG TPA: choice-of-anchor D domain-containing protein, partial [Candidatus Obscuribacterales bacterium]